MGRIRTVKPEFFSHERLSELPEATHLLAAGLLTYADDEGYFNANPGLIRAALSPLRDPSVSIQESLNRLSAIDWIRLGTGVDGRRYGQIVTFSAHQRVNRPTPSKIINLGIVWDDSVNDHGLITDESPLEGKGKEQGKEVEKEGNAAREAAPGVVAVFDYWRQRMNHPNAKLDPKREKAIKAALKLGYTPGDLCKAIDGCASSSWHMGQNDRNTVYDGLDLILRDGAHIDKFIKESVRPAAFNGLSSGGRQAAQAAAEWLAESEASRV